MLAEWLESRSRLLKAPNARHHVDDRLRRHAGYRRRADVMYAAVEPGCKDTLEKKTLSLEVPRPLGVVRDDENLLVRHRAKP